MNIAPLDRRVLVHIGQEPTIVPLSALRTEPFVVLLGEPGLGKSTALEHEAGAQGIPVITCREAMNGTPLPEAGTVYFDALDEYRSGENGKDKLLQLANAMIAGNLGSWRLTCRAEDWREAADLKAMQRAAGVGKVVVATLQPLDRTEARIVLAALGADDPEAFCEEALRRGGEAFLESPLSLRLLHTVVVANGVWPETRFELFESAIWALAHEENPDRVTDDRPSADAIVEVASQLCFYALASGARAIWRSNGLPPANGEYLALPSLTLPASQANSALDTALFRGEGHAFLPFHRTVAEYLAARFLARKTTGAAGGAAFPLRRSLALLTGQDRKAPSEMRGLYAWFAAHLNRLGDRSGALRLIEQDAATVLVYGDAAAFDTAGRRSILLNLDREDPYFLASHDEITVLGGLVEPGMVETFSTILDDDERGHVQRTVLEALSDGAALPGIQDKLAEIALSPRRRLWLRESAAAVHVKSAADPVATRRALIEELASQPLAPGQVMLRAALMAGAGGDELSAADIRRLLADSAALPSHGENEDIQDRGALTNLAWTLRNGGPSDLFDTPIAAEGVSLRQRFQLRSFIDLALASTILRHPSVPAERLWRWVSNAREHYWDMLDSGVIDAIKAWTDIDPESREIDLFLEIARSDPDRERPWVVINNFITTVRREPSARLVQSLLHLADAEADPQARRGLFHLAAYSGRTHALWPVWQDRIVAALNREPGNAEFVEDLLADPNASYKKQEAERLALIETKNATSRNNNIAAMTPELSVIAGGSADAFGILKWAADHYRTAMISAEKLPFSKITEFTNGEIAAAIAEGMIQFAINTDIKVEAENLGNAAGTNRHFSQELVVAAGLHQALRHGRSVELDNAPLTRALIGLRHAYFDGEGGEVLSAWSSRMLGADSVVGAELLLRYWNSALDAGDQNLDGLDKLVANEQFDLVKSCVSRLLNSRPDLPETALRQALVAAGRVLSDAEITGLADEHRKIDNLGQDQRNLWNFVGLALDPERFVALIDPDRLETVLLAPSGQLNQAMTERSTKPDQIDLIRVQILGERHAAKEDDWRGNDRPSAIVRAAIRRLGASKDPGAGDKLRALAARVDPSWTPSIAHTAAEHARALRDDLYTAPTVRQLVATLAGGPPVTPLDLMAVVMEELDRYRSTLRTGSEMPWKRYWNTDKDGRATSPQIENEDRDRLLELLRTRLEANRIVAGMPEARRGENTRADILLLSHGGYNLPIEAKRHFNRELWTAPTEQLKNYAADEGAHGFGVYLVFWFGEQFATPARRDGVGIPRTAEALEEALIADIPLHLKDKLSVVVLDVSRPKEMIEGLARSQLARERKRKPKP